MLTIDINCDLGEAFGNYPMPNDHLLMDYISSANIACGFHAGDPSVMRNTVELAVAKGVAIGAHPGFPDLQGFGRREMSFSTREIYELTLYQIGALHAFTKVAGGQLNHVKPHGALYNMAAKNSQMAEAIAKAVHDFNPSLFFFALAKSEMIIAAEKIGLRTVSEVFADRTYQDNGTLTPRSQPNSLITDPAKSTAQVLKMVTQQEVLSVNDKIISLKAETLCLHGDGEHAITFAQNIVSTLKSNNISIKAPAQ